MRKFLKMFFCRHKMVCKFGMIERSFWGTEMIFKDVYACQKCGKKKIRTAKREKSDEVI